MTIGQKILKFRTEKRIKQEESANFLEISQPTLSKIENGSGKILFEHVLNIAEYLKIDLSKFFPTDLAKLEQIERYTLIENHNNEIQTYKDTIAQLLKTIKNLEREIQGLK